MKKKIKYVFHIGDIHIRNISRHAEYLEVFEKLFIELKTIIGENDPEEYRIIIAGDLLHQKIQISNEQLIFTCELLNNLAKICQVVLIAGNHDLLENNKDRVDSITPIVRLLKNDNINYLKESKCYQDSNIVWCVYSIFEENKRPNIENGREVFGEDKTYIGLYHAPLNGAKTELGYQFEHSDNVEIFEGLDLVMCCDIHLRQKIPFKIPVVYCGSTIQQNFGEKLKGHGFLLWDIEKRIFKGIDIPNDNVMLQFKINGVNDVETNSEILTNE
jgi:DNA repair exonuclease SbcCD nuclease subunit